MSAPYDNATLDRVREFAVRGYPPGAAAYLLGWDMETLRRRSKHHGITFPVPKKILEKPLREMRWDGTYGWHGDSKVSLTRQEGEVFELLIIRKEMLWSATALAASMKCKRSTASVLITHLRKKLATIGLELTKKPFKLVKPRAQADY